MNDKVKHNLGGSAHRIGGGHPLLCQHLRPLCGVVGCTAGIIAGGVKEWCDNKYNWEWDWRDFAFTCIGVAIAVLIVLGLHFGKG